MGVRGDCHMVLIIDSCYDMDLLAHSDNDRTNVDLGTIHTSENMYVAS
jgi:hypothetical protein